MAFRVQGQCIISIRSRDAGLQIDGTAGCDRIGEIRIFEGKAFRFIQALAHFVIKCAVVVVAIVIEERHRFADLDVSRIGDVQGIEIHGKAIATVIEFAIQAKERLTIRPGHVGVSKVQVRARDVLDGIYDIAFVIREQQIGRVIVRPKDGHTVEFAPYLMFSLVTQFHPVLRQLIRCNHARCSGSRTIPIGSARKGYFGQRIIVDLGKSGDYFFAGGINIRGVKI